MARKLARKKTLENQYRKKRVENLKKVQPDQIIENELNSKILRILKVFELESLKSNNTLTKMIFRLGHF